MHDFTVVTQQNPHHTMITVTGDMDIKTYPQLREVAHTAATVPVNGQSLQLDLSGVSFMDSSGLNLLLLLRRRLTTAGGHFHVTGLQHQPKALLILTETYTLLVADTEHQESPHRGERRAGEGFAGIPCAAGR